MEHKKKRGERALNKTSVAVEVLKGLCSCFMCYERDASMFIASRYEGKSNMQSKVIKRLIDKEYIKRTKKNEGAAYKGTDDLLTITTKGVVALSNLYDTPYYEYLVDEAKEQFTSYSDPSRLLPRLDDNTLRLFFESSNVRAFTQNKPDLYYLYCHLPNQSEFIRNSFIEDEVNPLYQNKESLITKQLESGIFYTRQEFVDFVLKARGKTERDQIIIDRSEMDAVSQTRYRGIFISKSRVLLVYQQSRKRSGLISTIASVESNLKNIVEDLFKIPCELTEEINALFVSRSPNFAYNLVVGANGHTKYPDGDSRGYGARPIININSQLFDRYYVVSTSLGGCQEMDYIRTHSLEDYLDDCKNLFLSCEGFSLTGKKYPVAIDEDRHEYAFYFPFLEVSMLANIYKSKSNPTIITEPYLADVISHSIRKPSEYYDRELEQIETKLYDKFGYEEGTTPKSEKRKYNYHSAISITCTKDFHDKVKKAAKYEGMSVSAYIKKNLVGAVNNTIEKQKAFSDELKQNKKI